MEKIEVSRVLLSSRCGLNYNRFLIQPLQSENYQVKGNPAYLFKSAQFFDRNDDLRLNLEYASIEYLSHSVMPQHKLCPGEVIVPLKFARFDALLVPEFRDSTGFDKLKPCYVNNNSAVLTPDTERILPEFLVLCLRSEKLKRAVKLKATPQVKRQNGKNYDGIAFAATLELLTNLKLPVVSLTQQTEIVTTYLNVLQTKQKAENQLRRYLRTIDELV